MIAYKLVRKLKDGSLAPLFINKKMRFPLGEWLEAEPHRTRGFKFRPGFHCTTRLEAPHLSKEGRVWVQVEVEQYQSHQKPQHQGGVWVLAQRMKVIQEVNL